MIRGGHFWVGLSTDRACVVVRTYMFNVNTSEPYNTERINWRLTTVRLDCEMNLCIVY